MPKYSELLGPPQHILLESSFDLGKQKETAFCYRHASPSELDTAHSAYHTRHPLLRGSTPPWAAHSAPCDRPSLLTGPKAASYPRTPAKAGQWSVMSTGKTTPSKQGWAGPISCSWGFVFRGLFLFLFFKLGTQKEPEVKGKGIQRRNLQGRRERREAGGERAGAAERRRPVGGRVQSRHTQMRGDAAKARVECQAALLLRSLQQPGVQKRPHFSAFQSQPPATPVGCEFCPRLCEAQMPRQSLSFLIPCVAS